MSSEDLDSIQSYLSINGHVVGLNRFVSDFLKQSVVGVISTLNLEDYDVENITNIELIVPQEEIPINPIDAECSVLINGKPLEMNRFSKKIVSNSIKAMINSIKTEDNVKTIDVEITNIEDRQMKDAEITLKTNGNEVEINDFTSGILKETIFAVVTSLDTDDEISQMKINVEER